MGITEIVLLLAGVLIAVLSFVLPAKRETVAKETRELARDEIKTLVEKEMEGIRSHVDDVVDEAVGYAIEKTERSLERISNEKIMAVNEYSDTVLQEIRKNHEETVFLYDMLNDKHTNLKNTVSEVNKTVQEVAETKKEAEAMVSTFQQLVPDPVPQEEKVLKAPEPRPVSAIERLLGAKAAKEAPVRETPVRETPAMELHLSDDGSEVGGNNNERILELYKQGKSKVAIAKELGLGVGEVKLVIDLYKNL